MLYLSLIDRATIAIGSNGVLGLCSGTAPFTARHDSARTNHGTPVLGVGAHILAR